MKECPCGFVLIPDQSSSGHQARAQQDARNPEYSVESLWVERISLLEANTAWRLFASAWSLRRRVECNPSRPSFRYGEARIFVQLFLEENENARWVRFCRPHRAIQERELLILLLRLGRRLTNLRGDAD